MANLPQWLRDIDALLVDHYDADWYKELGEGGRSNAEIFIWMRTSSAGKGPVSIKGINGYLTNHGLIEPLMVVEEDTESPYNAVAKVLARMIDSEAADTIAYDEFVKIVNRLPPALSTHVVALKELGDTTVPRVAKVPSISQLENTRAWAEGGRK